MSLKVLAEPRALKTLPIRSVSSIAVANKYMWLGLNDGTIRRYPCEASSSSQGMKSNKIATEGVLRPKTSSELNLLYLHHLISSQAPMLMYSVYLWTQSRSTASHVSRRGNIVILTFRALSLWSWRLYGVPSLGRYASLMQLMRTSQDRFW